MFCYIQFLFYCKCVQLLLFNVFSNNVLICFISKRYIPYHLFAVIHCIFLSCFPALVNKGNCLFAKKEYEKAREFYKEALNNDSSCVEALYNLGKYCVWL